MGKYKSVYTLIINAVYLRTSPYIRVYTRVWHFAKTFMTLRFEQGISCILQGCSDHYTTSVDTNGCIIGYMSAKLRFDVAHRLLADVGRPALSRQHPRASHDCDFAKRGFKLSRPGRLCPVASECHVILVWVSLPVKLYLSPSHYASGSARTLRPYTCFHKCARAIKLDAKHIKMD
jgi:hypothetical protein